MRFYEECFAVGVAIEMVKCERLKNLIEPGKLLELSEASEVFRRCVYELVFRRVA
jgi:hypothetical protein